MQPGSECPLGSDSCTSSTRRRRAVSCGWLALSVGMRQVAVCNRTRGRTMRRRSRARQTAGGIRPRLLIVARSRGSIERLPLSRCHRVRRSVQSAASAKLTQWSAPVPADCRHRGFPWVAASDWGRYRSTLPEPPPFISASTSWLEKRLKSPGTECFRHEAATANSSACPRSSGNR